MRHLALVCIGTLALGCGAAPVEPETARVSVTLKLKSLLLHRDSSAAKWLAAAKEHREACETKAGDCRLLVNEKRDEFIKKQGIVTCRQPDTDREARCIADTLLNHGDVEGAVDFYGADLWCFDQLQSCIEAEETQAQSDAASAKAASRKKAIEQGESGIRQRARISLAAEKVNYLRSTLPPDADGECAAARDKADCISTAQNRLASLSAEYDKSDERYKNADAQAQYDEITLAEAKCYEPELTCLDGRLVKYGETPETRRVLDQNYAALERRQQLIEKLGMPASVSCLEQPTVLHQAEIVRSYQAYVREPVLYFRMQLHKVFLALHQAQVDCLKKAQGAGP